MTFEHDRSGWSRPWRAAGGLTAPETLQGGGREQKALMLKRSSFKETTKNVIIRSHWGSCGCIKLCYNKPLRWKSSQNIQSRFEREILWKHSKGQLDWLLKPPRDPPEVLNGVLERPEAKMRKCLVMLVVLLRGRLVVQLVRRSRLKYMQLLDGLTFVSRHSC